MLTRQTRRTVLGLLVVGVVAGVALEAAMDPLEDDGLAWIGLLGGMVAFGGVGAYWFNRLADVPEIVDERQTAIERRASRFSHGVLLLGVTVLALVLMLPFYSGPVWMALWALVIGSIVVHEGSIEYFRRTM